MMSITASMFDMKGWLFTILTVLAMANSIQNITVMHRNAQANLSPKTGSLNLSPNV